LEEKLTAMNDDFIKREVNLKRKYYFCEVKSHQKI